MSNIHNNIIDFCQLLKHNEMNNSNKHTRDLFSVSNYKRILADAFDRIGLSNCSEIREKLFRKSYLAELIRNIVDNKKTVPGLVLTYGTNNYAESVCYGNQQEYTLLNGQIYRKDELMSCNTIFDIASITKLFTGICIFILVEKKLLDLNKTVGYYDKRFRRISHLKIENILGFKVTLETEYRIDELDDKEQIENNIFNISVAEYRETRPYSDMNAIVLSYIIENITGQSFYDFINSNIIKKCNMVDTGDKIDEAELLRTSSNNFEIHDTKNVLLINKNVIKGVVHDPKARNFNRCGIGLKGHAGLFSTARDMGRFAQSIINEEIISRESIRIMSINRTGKLLGSNSYTQFLGYQCYSKHPIQSKSEIYHALSGYALGNGGYTGVQLTIDALNSIFVFVGTNRCHYRMTRTSIPRNTKNGSNFVISKWFAWERDKMIHEALNLCIQYSFIERYYPLLISQETYKEYCLN